MKKILLLLLVLSSIETFACDCASHSFTEKYSQSDFVASVKIIKNHELDTKEEIYKAEIEITDLFKGDSLKSIYVLGVKPDPVYVAVGSDCSLSIEENTELIVYGYKDRKDRYVIGMCSGLVYLGDFHGSHRKVLKSKAELESNQRELEALAILKSKKVTFTDETYFRQKTNLNQELKQFTGIELDKNYAFFQVVFDSDLKIKNVLQLSGFGGPIDQKLLDMIKTTEWKIKNSYNGPKVTNDRNLLLGISYYSKSKKLGVL